MLSLQFYVPTIWTVFSRVLHCVVSSSSVDRFERTRRSAAQVNGIPGLLSAVTLRTFNEHTDTPVKSMKLLLWLPLQSLPLPLVSAEAWVGYGSPFLSGLQKFIHRSHKLIKQWTKTEAIFIKALRHNLPFILASTLAWLPAEQFGLVIISAFSLFLSLCISSS